MELVYSGKVRDLYADGDDLIMVASDRVSVYNVVLPTPIPDKGRVLTQLSLWWFGRHADVIANHVISGTDVPAQWAGRAIRCRRLRMLPVECIARGYLAGLGLVSYNETGTICGVRLPPGLGEGSRLPEPVFTPTTKAAAGHDEPITRLAVAELVGARSRPSWNGSRWRSTGAARSWPRPAASSSPTPSWSSGWRPTGR